MPELAERIRVLVDAGIRPVSAEEAMGPGHREPRRPPAPRPARIAVACSAGAMLAAVALVAVLVAVLVGTSPTGPAARGPRLAALKAAARTAAAAPRPAGSGTWLAVTEDFVVDGLYRPAGGRPFAYRVAGVDRWSMDPLGTGREELTLGAPYFPTGADRAADRAAGSPRLGVPTTWVVRLPTDAPTAVAGQAAHGIGAAPALPAVVPSSTVRALSTDPATLRRQLQDELLGGYSDAATTMSLAGALLEEGATPAQRAALYRMVASLPGVTDRGRVRTDVTHRWGIAVSLDQHGQRTELVFDPRTSQVLEERWTTSSRVAGPPNTSSGATDTERLGFVVYRHVAVGPAPPPA
jgi:hypothetical protein